MDKAYTILHHVIERVELILHTFWGWICALAIILLNYIAGHEFTVGLVVGVTIMDAAWGIAVSLKRGEFALSELGRLTIAKIAVYGCVLLTFVGLDKIIDVDITTSIVASGIVLCELWSSCGSMLIIYPHMPFLRLLKKALTGEIASKLKIEPEEVEKVLKKGFKKPKKNEKNK